MREGWRRRPDLNRGWRFCRPLPYHLATAPVGTGDRSLLGMSGRVYRHDRQRRAGEKKEENIIRNETGGAPRVLSQVRGVEGAAKRPRNEAHQEGPQGPTFQAWCAEWSGRRSARVTKRT